VYIRDMSLLSESHPAILAEFLAGKFVIHKTNNKFSAMAIDQCHKQNNATVKDSAGKLDDKSCSIEMLDGSWFRDSKDVG